jgi:hypothetical protein
MYQSDVFGQNQLSWIFNFKTKLPNGFEPKASSKHNHVQLY